MPPRRMGQALMVDMAVGVVIPVRNAVRHLPAALASVCAQRPRPADIVVVDGASDDGSADVAGSFPGVRVLKQQGLGLAAARNQGIREVAGDLLAFCDADDEWTEYALKQRVDILAANPQSAAVIGAVEVRALTGEAIPGQQRARLGRRLPGYTPGALLVRREAYSAVGPFDERLRIGADSDWFVRLSQSAESLIILDEVVLLKGARTTSLSMEVETYRKDLLSVAWAYLRRRQAGAGAP